MGKVLKKILILAGIFLVVAIVVFFLLTRDREGDTVSYEAMEPATLPVVTLTVEDQEVNVLYGYTAEMDEAYMGETLTPLPEDRKLPVTISSYGNTVTGLSYEIRTLDGSSLIERNAISDWQEKDGRIQAEIPVQDLIGRNTEYRLRILVSTKDREAVSYYTRILWGQDMKTKEMLDYVNGFHDETFTKTDSNNFAVNLESDKSADNGTLAYTNIRSSFDQITWADLSPIQVGEPQVQILQMNQTFGSFLVRYELQAEGENDRIGTYLAEEYFCLNWSPQRFYLMAYERNVNQIFEASSDTITGEGIEFGVTMPERISLSESGKPASKDNGEKEYQVFVVNGELWSYCPENQEAVKIFTFRDDKEEGWRRNHQEYGIRTVNVDNYGNVEFFVFGYMNQGAHEGQTGLSYYRYVKADNALQEVFYIASDKPYQVLKEGIDTLAYKSSRELLYLKFDNNVYAVDYVGNEFVVVVENAEARGLVVNKAQDAIAWQQGDNLQEADSVRVLYLDSGESHVLEAGDGEYLRTQGFIDQDFILSIGRTSEIQRSGLEALYPQYALTITDQEGKEISRYQYDGIYISSVSVGEGQVHLSRLKKNASGDFEYIDEDTLMQSSAETGPVKETLAQKEGERRERIWYLPFTSASEGKKTLSVTSANKILYGEGSSMDLSHYAGTPAHTRYYAYAYGHLQEIRDRAGEAISLIYDQMGWVTDSKGNSIWRRTERKSSVSITIPEEAVVSGASDRLKGCITGILRKEGVKEDISDRLASGENAQAILSELLPGTVMDLSGCTLKQLFYYLNLGTPVIALSEDLGPILLIGYDQYNVELYDPVGGTVFKKGQNDAEEYFRQAGSQFLGYVK